VPIDPTDNSGISIVLEILWELRAPERDNRV
jgi:hypothetical protein